MHAMTTKKDLWLMCHPNLKKRVATIPSYNTVPGIFLCEPVENMSRKVKFGNQVVMDQYN